MTLTGLKFAPGDLLQAMDDFAVHPHHDLPDIRPAAERITERQSQ